VTSWKRRLSHLDNYNRKSGFHAQDEVAFEASLNGFDCDRILDLPSRFDSVAGSGQRMTPVRDTRSRLC
jgi:hypothetical protein